MGFFQKFLGKKDEYGQRYKDISNEERIVRDIERKKLSHNEREMIAILRKEKEANLQKALKYEQEKTRMDERRREMNMFKQGGFNLLE